MTTSTHREAAQEFDVGFFYITDVLHMKLRIVSFLMRLLIRHALYLESHGVPGIYLLLKGCSRAGLDHLSEHAHAKLSEDGHTIKSPEAQSQGKKRHQSKIH